VSLRFAALLLAAVLSCAGADSARAAPPPSIVASWVAGVTSSSADLRAKIDPEGPTAAYRFEYLSEAAYSANRAGHPSGDGFEGASLAPALGSGLLGGGTQPLAVSQHIVSLAPETAYRYRPVASSSAGTTIGPEHVLTTRAPTNAAVILDDRGWEMVSPVEKGGGSVGEPETLFGGGDFQAAASGSAVTYGSATAFAEAVGAAPVSQYVSSRGDSGWSARNVSAPLESNAYGDEPDGAPFRIFSPDLRRALMVDGGRCVAAGTCPPNYSLWEGGSFSVLPTLQGLRLAGADPDLRHVVFTAASGLYEWGGASLAALSSVSGAALAAPVGAVSADGGRVYFTAAGNLYLHEGATTYQVDSAEGGGGTFQAASEDGSVAFLTDAGHLYRYLAGGAATDIAPAGGVTGVLGASPSGGDVYYQDGSGLWHWHEGTATEILPGAGIAASSDYPPATATARVSADGAHLAFLSKAEIPPFDNLDAGTESPDTELYLYGPSPGGGPSRLVCPSCNPTGERPRGSASIPGAEVNGSTTAYRPRALSASGNRVFFDTGDRLAVGDTDGGRDVYEWEAQGEGSCTTPPGCVSPVTGGRTTGGRFVDASADGGDVYFISEESLVGSDPGSIDLYDYRTGGGFPQPPTPIPCVGDSCQPPPSPPDELSPGTLVPTSPNPAARYFGPTKRHARKSHPKRKRHRHSSGKNRRRGARRG
jgi:hypothetical protein